MDIIQLVGVALVATLIAVLVRQSRVPEGALLIGLVVGAGIFLSMLDKIFAVVEVFGELSSRANINQFYLAIILKIIGVAYISEFGAQVCRDAGENAIAARVEFAAKIIIMVLAIPIITAILEAIIRLLP